MSNVSYFCRFLVNFTQKIWNNVVFFYCSEHYIFGASGLQRGGDEDLFHGLPDAIQ